MEELEKIIAILRINYDVAKKQTFIENPLAYALYHTWRFADTHSVKHITHYKGKILESEVETDIPTNRPTDITDRPTESEGEKNEI